MKYLISYDLIEGEDRDYVEIYNALENLGAKRILESQWAVKCKYKTADELFEYLISLKSEDDEYLFIQGDILLVNALTDWQCTPTFLFDLNKI